jgi:hypothetical protein
MYGVDGRTEVSSRVEIFYLYYHYNSERAKKKERKKRKPKKKGKPRNGAVQVKLKTAAAQTLWHYGIPGFRCSYTDTSIGQPQEMSLSALPSWREHGGS